MIRAFRRSLPPPSPDREGTDAMVTQLIETPDRSDRISRADVEALRDYARSLEEELDGPDAGEGEALVRINYRLAEADTEIYLAELDLGGKCPDNTEDPDGPHVSSPSLCVFCLEYR